MTPNRQMFKIVSIIYFLSGHLDFVFVDLPVVNEHTGLVVAHALLEALKHHFLIVEDFKQELVGGTMDGQYFMLHVPFHLFMLIGLHDSPL